MPGSSALSSLLQKHAHEITSTILVSPRPVEHSALQWQPINIIIDAHGFLQALCDEVARRSSESLGELQCARSALVYLISRLRAVYGMDLVFAVGSPDAAKPSDVALCDEGSNLDAQPFTKRCSLLLLIPQLFKTLNNMNVNIIHLNDELECYIGELMRDFNPLCVMTSDAEFAVIPGIPVTLDFDIPWEAMLHRWDPSLPYDLSVPYFTPSTTLTEEVPLSVRVFTFSAIAMRSNLTEEAIIQLASDVHDGQQPSGPPEAILAAIRGFHDRIEQKRCAPPLAPEAVALHRDLTALRLPASLVTLIQTGRCSDLFTQPVHGNLMYSVDIPTLGRLRHVLAHLLGLTSFQIRVHEGIELPSHAVIVPPSWGDRKEGKWCKLDVSLPKRVRALLPEKWNDFQPSPDEELEEKLLIVATAFEMRWDYAKTLADATHNSTPAVELPSSWLLLLWAVHGGCTSMEELRRIAMMMMLIYLSQRDEYSAQADAARHLMKFLPRGPTSQIEMNNVRALELSHLFATVYVEVDQLLTLLRVRSILNFPEPADVFSGAVLRDLAAVGSQPIAQWFLSSFALSDAAHGLDTWTHLQDNISDLGRLVENLFETFGKAFERIQFLPKADDTLCGNNPPLGHTSLTSAQADLEALHAAFQHLVTDTVSVSSPSSIVTIPPKSTDTSKAAAKRSKKNSPQGQDCMTLANTVSASTSSVSASTSTTIIPTPASVTTPQPKKKAAKSRIEEASKNATGPQRCPPFVIDTAPSRNVGVKHLAGTFDSQRDLHPATLQGRKPMCVSGNKSKTTKEPAEKSCSCAACRKSTNKESLRIDARDNKRYCYVCWAKSGYELCQECGAFAKGHRELSPYDRGALSSEFFCELCWLPFKKATLPQKKAATITKREETHKKKTDPHYEGAQHSAARAIAFPPVSCRWRQWRHLSFSARFASSNVAAPQPDKYFWENIKNSTIVAAEPRIEFVHKATTVSNCATDCFAINCETSDCSSCFSKACADSIFSTTP